MDSKSLVDWARWTSPLSSAPYCRPAPPGARGERHPDDAIRTMVLGDRAMRTIPSAPLKRAASDFDFESMLHPAHAFVHPDAVVSDPDLSLAEKRAILIAWASDAAEAPEGSGPLAPVPVDEILDALRGLDHAAQFTAEDGERCRVALRQRWRRTLLRGRARGRDDGPRT
jgi:hypothetical protein